MNRSAERHLAKARDYVARGEEFYRKAAAEIVAAQEADPTLGYRDIAERIGRTYRFVQAVVAWSTSDPYTDQLPFSEPKGAVATRHARSVLRNADPEEVKEILSEPKVRANVSKALDSHYRERAAGAATARRERRVADHGGEKEHVEHEQRQRLAELVNVVRGAVSALRFAASQAKTLGLDIDDTGAAEELTELVDEIVGFGSMLKEYLAGRPITDEDIAELIGGR